MSTPDEQLPELDQQYLRIESDPASLLMALGKIGVLHPDFVLPPDPDMKRRVLDAGLTILAAMGAYPENEGQNKRVQVLPWAHEAAITPLSKSNTDALTPVGVKFVGRLLNVPVLPSSATRAVGVDFVTCSVMPRLVQKGVRHITPERQAQVLLTLLGQSPRAINDTLGFGYTTPETALPGYRRTLIGSAHRVFTSRQLMKMYDAAVAHIASNATRRVDKARADKVPLLPN